MSSKESNMVLVKVIPKFETNEKGIVINTGEFANSRFIPFDKKVRVTVKEMQTIKRLKKITSQKENLSIKEIMDKYKVDENRANAIKKQPMLGERIVKRELYSVITL